MTQHRFPYDNRYCLFYTKDTGTITGVVGTVRHWRRLHGKLHELSKKVVNFRV